MRISDTTEVIDTALSTRDMQARLRIWVQSVDRLTDDAVAITLQASVSPSPLLSSILPMKVFL